MKGRKSRGSVVQDNTEIDDFAFETSVASPFGPEQFDLSLSRGLRDLWQAQPELALEEEWSDVADDDGKHWVRSLSLTLGTLRRVRSLASGRSDVLIDCAVHMHVEPGKDNEYSRVELFGKGDELDESFEWPDAVVDAFHTLIEGLLDGAYPPTERQKLSGAGTSQWTSRALVDEDWAGRGHQLVLAFTDESYLRRASFDVAALRAAANAEPRAFEVISRESGHVLVYPLLTEIVEAKLACLDAPICTVERFWLELALDGVGRVRSVCISCDDAARAEDLVDEGSSEFLDRLEDEFLGAAASLEQFQLEET